jgi:hypothetical protein
MALAVRIKYKENTPEAQDLVLDCDEALDEEGCIVDTKDDYFVVEYPSKRYAEMAKERIGTTIAFEEVEDD